MPREQHTAADRQNYKSDEEEEPYRYRQGDDDYIYEQEESMKRDEPEPFTIEVDSDMEEDQGQEKNNRNPKPFSLFSFTTPPHSEDDDGDEQNDENEPFDFQGPRNIDTNEEAPGEDIDVAGGCEFPDDQPFGGSDDDDVFYGDEHNAEHTAVARSNDGVRIKNVGKQTHVSLAAYAMFVLQDRPGQPSRFQGSAGNLGQLIVIDMCCRIMEQRMDVLTDKRAEFPRAFPRTHLQKLYAEMVQKKYKGKMQLGMLVTMPSTVPGTAKYQRDLVMHGMKLRNELGIPHLFITFTGNPKWPEIKRECEKQNCTWADIPEFTNRVFRKRWEMFLEDVVGKKKKVAALNGKHIREPGMFGNVVWYIYSVEFQSRGMPHCHLLVCLEEGVYETAQIDEIISANVPDYPSSMDSQADEKLRYYNLVRDMMTHFPCKGKPDAYCNQEKKRHWKQCCKGFPKPYAEVTTMSDNQYPVYQRDETNYFELRRGKDTIKAGSEYVVSHNKQLLMKYECHVNIEIVSSIKTMKYMFKYIHKGSDRVLLEATERNGKARLAPDQMTLSRNVFAPSNMDKALKLKREKQADEAMGNVSKESNGRWKYDRNKHLAFNECSYRMDMASMTSCEGAWKIAGNQMHGSSHIVHRAYVHEEGRDVMMTTRGVDAAKARKMLKQKVRGMMPAWFEKNQKPDELPKMRPNDPTRTTLDLNLEEMLHYYKWNTQKQEFILRKRDYSHRILGRIQAPEPRFLQLTATRLLAQTVTGPTSWEDLRTFEGRVYETCLDAARARGLMNGNDEWDRALKEITDTEYPIVCRRFFASILIHCAPVNPKELWEKYWEQLAESVKKGWSDAQRKAHALRHIQWLLARHGLTLADYQLADSYSDADFPLASDENIDAPDVIPRTTKEHKKDGKSMYKQLNKMQQKFVDRALELDEECDKGRMMAVEAPGGTGKTFCYKTIYNMLKGRGRRVICVSHTGIAACLLPDGCTAHRKFSIPLTITKDFACKVDPSSPEGIALAGVDCVIWDEICMTDVRILNAVDVMFKLLKQNELPFGGTLMIMGGDWRQILPIVHGVKGRGVMPYLIKTGEIWKDVEKFTLTENKRAEKDPAYARRILQIGDGSNFVSKNSNMVHIPEEYVIRKSDKALADWVFPDVNDIEKTKNAALLTVDNKTALRLNDYVLDKLDGECRVFTSTDEPDTNCGLTADPTVFHSQTPSGMPPHELKLKVGAQVVLLRNISVEQGLCNGTRLTVKKFGTDLIEFTVNNPTTRSPETVFLHRMMMSPSGSGAESVGFKRRQYPIRLAYACTINKSQGQTLSRCGLVLHSAVFSHGQLYVAMSRVQQADDFRVYHTKRINSPEFDFFPQGGILVRNVVYNEVFEEATTVLENLEYSKNTVMKDRAAPATSSSSSSSETDDSFENPKTGSGFKVFKSLKKMFSKKKTATSKSLTPSPSRPPPDDLPYLLLRNSGTDCFLIVLCNMLFNCPEIRDKYIGCTDESQPIGFQLGRIFRREVTNVIQLRKLFPDQYQVDHQCIREILSEVLMKKLADEDLLGLEVMMVDQTGTCSKCNLPNTQRQHHRSPFAFITLKLLSDGSFDDCFDDWVTHQDDTLCHQCGDLNYPKLMNNYLIVDVAQEGHRFTDFFEGRTFFMFGAEYRLRALAEYQPTARDFREGHHTSWIRDGSDWVHVDDHRRDKNSSFYSHFSSLLVFEKL